MCEAESWWELLIAQGAQLSALCQPRRWNGGAGGWEDWERGCMCTCGWIHAYVDTSNSLHNRSWYSTVEQL